MTIHTQPAAIDSVKKRLIALKMRKRQAEAVTRRGSMA